MRTNPATGNKDQIPVHIKAIENHKTDDVPMKSNDILYIPDSRGRRCWQEAPRRRWASGRRLRFIVRSSIRVTRDTDSH